MAKSSFRPSTVGHSLTFTLVDTMGRAVVTGKYDGQTFPTEAEIAAAHGVSRSVIREAMKMLAAKGLVGARPRQGTTVRDFSDWNLLDPDVLRWMLHRTFSLDLLRQLTELRLAIEPQAAAMAALRADETDLLKLTTALERMRAAGRGEDDAVAALIDFHVQVLRASKNPLFAQFRDLISTAVPLSERYGSSRGNIANNPNYAHLTDAIKNRDSNGAARWMQRLIEDLLAVFDQAA